VSNESRDATSQQPPPPPLPIEKPSAPPALLDDAGNRVLDVIHQEGDRYDKILKWRRRIGYCLAVFGIGGIIYLAYHVIRNLEAIVDKPPTTPLLYIYVGGHAVVTVALVFFAYQLIRAAERLIMPHWWTVETARTMLGIRDPLSQTTKVAERFAGKIIQFMNALKDLKGDK
jgi:hypothetical protein